MPRAPRFFEPGVPQLITSGTIMNQDLIPSSQQAAEQIAGLLARYVERYKIELYAFVFQPNGFQMIASGPEDKPCELAYFLRDLKSGLSRKLGALIGYQGIFFSSRYKAVAILDQESLLEQVAYIHELADGYGAEGKYIFSSLADYEEGKRCQGHARSFEWEDRVAYHKHGGSRRSAERVFERNTLRVHLLEEVQNEEETGQRRSLAPSPQRAGCLAKDEEEREAFIGRRKTFRVKFKPASKALISGDVCGAVFPQNSFKPTPKESWRARIFLEEQEMAI